MTAPPAARDALKQVMPSRGESDSHPGLLLQRYLLKWAAGKQGEPEEKRAILQAAINASVKPEVLELYKAAFDRWQASLPEQIAGDLQTLGRLIVGLGSENVLETGIRLHHTYGMPILPGSALKGLAAHYCDQVWGAAEEKFKKPTPEDDKAYRKWLDGQGPKPDDNFHRLLFGTTDDSGSIVFHDAWFVPDFDPDKKGLLKPDKKGLLKLDVMTPHHSGWNNLDKLEPPTDFDSPTPVPFLSVAGRFHVAVSWHGPASPESAKWTQRAHDLLVDALCNWGIGGKTTSGYGLFDEEKWKADSAKRTAEAEQKQIAAEKEAALAAMSPLDRSIKEFLESHPNKESPEFMRLYEELKKEGCKWTTQEDRRVVAEKVKQGMIKAKKWKDKDKDGERKKFIEQILGGT